MAAEIPTVSSISPFHYGVNGLHGTKNGGLEEDQTGSPPKIRAGKENDSPQNTPEELSREEQQEITELKRRDAEVRAHEMAHLAAGGQYVHGGAQFEYTTGPDGKRYASGGEVSIDTSPVSGDPEATIRKMQVVRKAALAPANPSSQDRSVAAAASQRETQARRELAQQKSELGKNSGHDHSLSETKRTSGYDSSGSLIRKSADAAVSVLNMVV